MRFFDSVFLRIAQKNSAQNDERWLHTRGKASPMNPIDFAAEDVYNLKHSGAHVLKARVGDAKLDFVKVGLCRPYRFFVDAYPL